LNAVTLPLRAEHNGAIVNGLSVDVEDWFQVGAFEDVIERDDWGGLPDRLDRNVGEILDLGQRQGLRGQAQGQDRRVGRVDLGVDRRRRQVGRQQVARSIDRRLHLLLGDVEVERQGELQSDDRGAGRADRRHLVEAGHLPQLHFQR